MQHIVVLIREVPDDDDEAKAFKQMAESGEPHTWRTFAPFRNQLMDYGFTMGETVVMDADGNVILRTLVNTKDSVLNIQGQQVIVTKK